MSSPVADVTLACVSLLGLGFFLMCAMGSTCFILFCCGGHRYMPAGGPDSHFQSDKRMRWKAKQDAMRESAKGGAKEEV